MRLLGSVAALAICAGCAQVSSSAYVLDERDAQAAAAADPVAASGVRAAHVGVLLTRDPSSAREIAVVEAHGRRPAATLQALVDELRARSASVGGDVVRVDAFATRFENVTEPYTYDCGTTRTVSEPRTVTRMGANGQMSTQTEMVTVTKHEPKTCHGTREVEAEVLTLTGRAFRTNGETR